MYNNAFFQNAPLCESNVSYQSVHVRSCVCCVCVFLHYYTGTSKK